MASKSMWQEILPKRGSQCDGCGNSFSPGADYHSLVREGRDVTWQRRDYCPSCWPLRPQEERELSCLTQWKGKVPLKKQEAAFSWSREEKVFEALKAVLLEAGAERQAFILASYLAHARFLAMRGEASRPEGVVCLFEAVESGEMVGVKKVFLGSSPLQEIREVLEKVFVA